MPSVPGPAFAPRSVELAVTARDILPNHRFESIRPRLQPLVAKIRKQRRHRVSPHCMVAFENRETVLWQIQEVLRVEGRLEQHHVDEELVRYRALLPRPGELRATVYVDGGPVEIADALCERIGTDSSALELRVDRKSCFAECVDERPEVSSPVRYVRFPIEASGIRVRELASRPARLLLSGSSNPSAYLPSDVRRALATDLSVARPPHLASDSLRRRLSRDRTAMGA